MTSPRTGQTQSPAPTVEEGKERSNETPRA